MILVCADPQLVLKEENVVSMGTPVSIGEPIDFCQNYLPELRHY